MKFKKVFIPLLTLSLQSFNIKKASPPYNGRAYNNSLQLDLTDSTEQEIKDYYSYDTMISKSGDDLKSYLYDKISANNYFLKYDSSYDTKTGVSCWYRITDRNWDISTNSVDTSTYKFENDSPSGYRLVNMYYSNTANNDINKATNNKVNSFAADSTVQLVDYQNSKKPLPDGWKSPYIQVDKEHVWAKNHGFKVKNGNSDVFANGAPTDLHHLVAADHMTNSQGHNDDFYGEVKDKSASTTTTIYAYYGDGTKEISGYRGLDEFGETVFEPTNEWKGDIARCLLYMETRYSKNNPDGNTQAEPYLVFSDDLNFEDDNTTFIGHHRNLDTYLKWNTLDPVSNYEKHRNNLIYKNVQRNRNPYIDYPQLANQVYSSKSDLSKLQESYTLKMGDILSLDIIFGDNDTVEVNFESTFINLSENKKNVIPIKQGESKLTYEITDKSGTQTTYKTKINVVDQTLVEGENTSSFTEFPKETYIHVGDTIEYDIYLCNKDDVNIVFDTTMLQKKDDNKSYTAIKEGNSEIKYSVKDINLNTYEYKTKVTVTKPVELINSNIVKDNGENIDSIDILSGNDFSIKFDATNLLPNEKIKYSSSDLQVASVSEDGIIKAKKEGTSNIQITVEKNGTSNKLLQEFTVNVKKNTTIDKNTLILLIILSSSILVAIVIVIIIVNISKSKRKKLKK